MDQQMIKTALTILAEAPALINNFGLGPNIKAPTMGGDVWWNDIASSRGWRVQRNTLTGHCRILDYLNYRQAWGSEQAIMVFFQKLLDGRCD
jgi:hypothetical protein